MNISTNLNFQSPASNVQNVTFKNTAQLSSLFNLLNKHEIIGVSAVDLGSMVIPRTFIDFTRNPSAGVETGIRESSSTATLASIGLAGIGASSILSRFLRHKNYNVDFKSITADSDTIDIFSNVFKKIVKNNDGLSKKELSQKFLTEMFSDVKGLAGNNNIKDSKLWYSLKPENTKDIVETLVNEISNNKNFSLPQNKLDILRAKMNFDIPCTDNLSVNINGKKLLTKGVNFINDAYSLTKAFVQDNVLKTFKNSGDDLAEFSKDLKSLSLKKTVLGLSAMAAISLSMQSINAYITKKRTGKSGFVGNPDFQQNSTNNQILKKKDILPFKLISATGMGYFIFKTINAKSVKEFFQKIQFRGKLPTVNQIKVVYGTTIIGRLLAARDKTELKESAFRDFLGFTNFLLLGSLVTKLFVNAKDKSLITYDKAIHGNGFFNWLKNSGVKTHEELINSTLKGNVIGSKGLKAIKELYTSGAIKKGSILDNKLKILNSAKIIGLLYSGIALGILVPIINKKMTEHHFKKGQAENIQKKTPALSEIEAKQLEVISMFLNRKHNIV